MKYYDRKISFLVNIHFLLIEKTIQERFLQHIVT